MEDKSEGKSKELWWLRAQGHLAELAESMLNRDIAKQYVIQMFETVLEELKNKK